MSSSDRSLLFEWDHHRALCVGCGANILWPDDEGSAPHCEPCWDLEADADPVRSFHHRFTVSEIAQIARSVEWATSLPRGNRLRQLQAIADDWGCTTRTLYRIAEKAAECLPVELNGWRALFVMDANGPRRISAWHQAT